MLANPIIAKTAVDQMVLGMSHDYRLTPADGFGLAVLATVPPGLGAPTHRHEVDEELFFVVEGELTVDLDGRTHRLSAGDSCHIPVGSVHAFRNESQSDTRFLALVTPGTDLQKFFDSVESRSAQTDPEPEAIAAAAAVARMAFV
jgi:quercetin dioxygenase-like cupin family protein